MTRPQTDFSRIGAVAIVLSTMLFFLLPQSCSSVSEPEISLDFQPLAARQLVEALAHDSLEGRNTPSRGLDQAARMIAAEFKAAGLEALRPGYLHPYELERLQLDTTSSMSVTFTGGTEKFELKTDFIPYGFSAAQQLQNAKVVFAGYGITDSARAYDDYADIDAEGAVVLVMRGEPGMEDSSSVFDGLRLTKRAQLRTKVETAVAHGAVALLIVNGPRQSKTLEPRGFDWPVLYPDAGLRQLPYRPAFRSKRRIPVVHVGAAVVDALMGSQDALAEAQTAIDQSGTPGSRQLKNRSVSLDIRLHKEVAISNNVVGKLAGRRESGAIVVGAHYDHVGTFFLGTDEDDAEIRTEIDSICNGADDNASGTAALILAARSLAKLQPTLERSIIFVAFSGEERGLYGSEAFVQIDSTFDRTQCSAMFNLDMISRNANDSLHLGGGSRSTMLRTWCFEANAELSDGFVLTEDIESFYRRSDQWNFAKYGIPSLFYFSGTHEDYHMPSDEVDKIDFDKLARVAELCTRTVLKAARSVEPADYVYQGDEISATEDSAD